jgi:hypothetical protein
MDTPIATARTIHLAQRAANQFVWIHDDDSTDYSGIFATADAAKAWLFTPVVIQPSTAPEVP